MNRSSLANARVGKILELSRDFQAHRHKLISIQAHNPQLLTLKKRANKLFQLLKQKNRNFRNIQNLKQKQLQRENFKFGMRLATIMTRDPQKLSKSNSKQSLGSLRLSRSSSARSINSTFKDRESKRIVRENTELGTRIINVKPEKSMELGKLKEDYRNQRKYVRSISRFSEKNRRLMTSIVQKGLLLKKKQVHFLPNILKQKCITTRQSHKSSPRILS